jgi:hypothetical protein
MVLVHFKIMLRRKILNPTEVVVDSWNGACRVNEVVLATLATWYQFPVEPVRIQDPGANSERNWVLVPVTVVEPFVNKAVPHCVTTEASGYPIWIGIVVPPEFAVEPVKVREVVPPTTEIWFKQTMALEPPKRCK